MFYASKSLVDLNFDCINACAYAGQLRVVVISTCICVSCCFSNSKYSQNESRSSLRFLTIYWRGDRSGIRTHATEVTIKVYRISGVIKIFASQLSL